MTLLPAMTPPMPTPVTSRSSPSWRASPARADSSIPDADNPRQARISARRPTRSATGARNSDPSAIPTSAELSSRPSSTPDSPHSAETAAAVNDMTSTSAPSTTFSRTHTAIADHCVRDIGASSMRARRREGLIRPVSAAGARPGFVRRLEDRAHTHQYDRGSVAILAGMGSIATDPWWSADGYDGPAGADPVAAAEAAVAPAGIDSQAAAGVDGDQVDLAVTAQVHGRDLVIAPAGAGLGAGRQADAAVRVGVGGEPEPA